MITVTDVDVIAMSTKSDSEIEAFVEELLAQPPALVTHEDLANYKQQLATLISNKEREARVKAIKGYKKINNKLENEIRIDELYKLYPSITVDGYFTVDGEKIKDRIEQLKAREGK